MNLDISAVGAFKTGTSLIIDAHTDPATGPNESPVTLSNPLSISLDGYGLAFLLLKP